MKIRIANLEPGQRFRFGRTTNFAYEDQNDKPVLEREVTNHIDVHECVAIEVRSVRTYNQTGRRGREYVITLGNGRQVAVTPQTKLEVFDDAPVRRIDITDTLYLVDLGGEQEGGYAAPAIVLGNPFALSPDLLSERIEDAFGITGGWLGRGGTVKVRIVIEEVSS